MTTRPLQVRLLGTFGASQAGRELFLRPGPRAVLAALVLAGADGLPTTELADLLWGDDPPVAPVAGVRAHVETVASQLDASPSAPALDRTADGWRLWCPVGTDAEALRERVVQARARLDAHAPGQACALLAGDLGATFGRPLEDLPQPWFAAHRRSLEQLLAAALVTYARACTEDGDPHEAVRLLDRGLQVTSLAGEPDVWEGLVRAHLAAGGAARAVEILATAAVLRHAPERVARLRRLVEDAGPTPFARRIADQTARRLQEPRDRTTSPVAPATLVPHVVPPRRTVPATPPRLPDPAVLGFRLFGRDRLLRSGTPVRAGGWTDAVLAVLLARRGTAVGLDELARAVWGDDLPLKPRVAVEVNLAALRDACDPAPLPVVALDGPAWRLDARTDSVDADALAARAAAGRESLAQGRVQEAATTLRAALGRVAGRPLDGLDGDWFEAERDRLERWWTGVVWSCVVAEVSCGRTGDALPDLRALAAANPLREDVWEWLVLATARHEGRDAGLAVYAEAARHLQRLLGAAPGPALEGVRRRVEAGQP